MAKKGTTWNLFRTVVTAVVFPVMLLDTYAFIQLHETAGSWAISIIPGSLSETMTQLALILALNLGLIIFFVIYFRTSKSGKKQ